MHCLQSSRNLLTGVLGATSFLEGGSIVSRPVTPVRLSACYNGWDRDVKERHGPFQSCLCLVPQNVACLLCGKRRWWFLCCKCRCWCLTKGGNGCTSCCMQVCLCIQIRVAAWRFIQMSSRSSVLPSLPLGMLFPLMKVMLINKSSL